jgi:thiosulfate/3-mercaptopyruvate sulfurtransferase
MPKSWIAIPTVLLVALTSRAADDDVNTCRLVMFDELEQRLPDPDVRILDARTRADYDKGHIPGAVWVDVKAAESMAAKPGALTDRARWEKWIAPLGIGPNSHVLVYDANRQRDAARVWWLLGYLGVKQVGLLNGIFPLWASEKRPVSTEVSAVRPEPFPVNFQKARHATRDDVASALDTKSAVIVDARSEAEYRGEEKRAKRAGHIPTACSLEWTNFVTPDGRFLDDKALRAKIEKAGVKSGASIITHCQSGGRSSVQAFVLERLGFKTKNYYLGWSDWGNAEDTPVKVEEPRKSGE